MDDFTRGNGLSPLRVEPRVSLVSPPPSPPTSPLHSFHHFQCRCLTVSEHWVLHCCAKGLQLGFNSSLWGNPRLQNSPTFGFSIDQSIRCRGSTILFTLRHDPICNIPTERTSLLHAPNNMELAFTLGHRPYSSGTSSVDEGTRLRQTLRPFIYVLLTD